MSNWKKDGGLTMHVVIPPNTTATVWVPAKTEKDVTESGRRAASARGVKFMRMENGAALFDVGSGAYTFETPAP